MNKPEYLYQEDVQNFLDITERFAELQDTDYLIAYKLHKDALGQYERWSTILFETRRLEVSNKKDPPWKNRIEDIMKILNNIYTSSRMVWNKSKDDLNEGKYWGGILWR